MRALSLHRRGTEAAPPPAQGHGSSQAHKATRPFHVLEKGPCHGKLTIVSFSLYIFLHRIPLSFLCRLPSKFL